MSYEHLTQDERYQIAALRGIGLGIGRIASRTHRSPSTISRELRRNGSDEGYAAQAAHQRAHLRRRQASSQPRIETSTWGEVADLLREQWSPEQIVGRLRSEGRPVPSHEWIYRHIGADRCQGGSLWRHLRCQRQRRHRYGSCRRGRFSQARSIHDRPMGVASRRQVGHWEADTVVSSQSVVSLLTLAERASRYVRIKRVINRQAETVTCAMVGALTPFIGRAKSVTMDRGSEFADYAALELALGTTTYFADPYSAWQRGTNENSNGLIRQYIPKGQDMATLTDEDIQRIEDRLNNRPRKTLGFRTPREVMQASLERLALRS